MLKCIPGPAGPGLALLIAWLALVPPAPALAQWELGGRLQQEAAFRFGDDEAFTKGLAFLQLEGSRWLSSGMRFTAIGRIHYDPVLDWADPADLNPHLAPGDPVADDFSGAEFKEVYVDLLAESVDLRLGRQIVRWGLLEGARITDRINPLDFSEFIFREVEDRYIPLWMARISWYPEWGQVQLLAIPDMVFHEPAPLGSEWEEFQVPPDIRRPNASPENTEAAVRVGWRMFETDINASYFYTWDDFPAAYRSIFGVAGQPTGVAFDARHERMHVFGLTLSRNVRRSVLSVEAAYDRGKYLATDAGALPGNEIKRDMARWGVGLDMNIAGVDVSAVYFQEHILHWRPFIPANRVEEAANLMIRERFFNDRLDTELLALYFVTGRQYVVRPKVTWRMTDHWGLSVGVDMLGGEAGSDPGDPAGARDFRFVGYFRNHDRVDMKLSYRF